MLYAMRDRDGWRLVNAVGFVMAHVGSVDCAIRFAAKANLSLTWVD